MLPKLILGSIWTLLGGAYLGLAAGEPINVCDLVEDAQHFDERIVVVRGLIANSFLDSQYLNYDELRSLHDCGGKRSGAVKIRILAPDVYFLTNPPIGYKPDPKSAKRAEHIVGKFHGQPFLATIVGAFYVNKQPPEGRQKPRPGVNDFDLTGYEGVIVIAAFKDIKRVGDDERTGAIVAR
jgi:hypothetical protein